MATTSPALAAQPSSMNRRPQDGCSYVVGEREPPLNDLTVFGLLAATAERYPEHDAAVFVAAGVRWTWAALVREVEACAAGLVQLGVRCGDRVGIWSPNRPEWLITQFATARLGAILVTINPAYRVAELEYALNLSGVSVLVSATRFKTSHYLGMLQALGFGTEPAAGSGHRLPHLRTVISLHDAQAEAPIEAAQPGFMPWTDLMAQGWAAQRAGIALPDSNALHSQQAINIQFTSGTTGSPKGATLTHHNIVNNAEAVAHCMRLSAVDRLCIPVPLYHCFGMVLAVLACTTCGAAMVFPGEAFEPAETLAAVQNERCTALHGVPTMFIAELDHPNFANYDLSRLRTGIMAGAPCPVEVMRRVQSQMHLTEITIAYGMTETSPVSFQSATDDPLEKRVSTVGRILPHLEVKIVDAEGKIVPIGERGELCTRGYSVMQGYWNDAERSAQVVRDGWMYTGDLATLDDEGYCNIVGRVKDMVIRGGENIYPREIEEFLFRHPKVAAVQVFGIPDARYGEALCCWIVLKPGQSCDAESIRQFCQDQIAHYKVPKHVCFVDELPITVTGKPQKFIMRARMMEMLGGCLTLGVEAKTQLGEDSFGRFCRSIVDTMDQKSEQKWTGEVGLQPTFLKSDSLLGLSAESASADPSGAAS